ncbi:hypothetical protein KFK09_024053 [Dendrobium nobile]|uniref:Transposase n=1 Tax=Dendrobium nobile TaxID=94219 RepID=A0A8T3ABL0_DENNO|nr:hypothetical protein KFK09_024053 [Dendrobium nobile]
MPPWSGMKQSSFILSMIIPGEKSPGNDIDIYLKPLIHESQQLWQGVQCYDAASGENFMMRAALLWTINDFPAYGILSGWSTKGRFACPCCAHNTESLWLYKSKKFAYMGHRCWLTSSHSFHKQKQYFDNINELRSAPSRISGSKICTELQNHQFALGKIDKDRLKILKRGYEAAMSSNDSMVTKWKKKSIFFYLSYWQYNTLPHNLDAMHIEKNFFDNIISTLLDLEKSKDNLQARKDLVQIGVKPELHPHVLLDGSYVLPPALFTMSKKDKMMFCEVLRNMKLPKGYSSNISKGVNIKECKIIGLKCHDCHILIKDIMPIALRSCAPSNEVLTIIIGISHFLKFMWEGHKSN